MFTLYSNRVLQGLSQQLERNQSVLKRLQSVLVDSIRRGEFLMVAGSGHSAIFAMELYHRAGGPSFLIPVVDERVLPLFGPSKARSAERTPDALYSVLNRAQPKAGEMIWINSQSGINPAIVELALESKRRGLKTVAFTSVPHSSSVSSRHSSGKRLFEICDEVVDLGGVPGDALIPVAGAPRAISVGPFSTLSAVFLAHSLLVEVCSELEKEGFSCVYTSVNTPDGERQNRELEQRAAIRDALLRSE